MASFQGHDPAQLRAPVAPALARSCAPVGASRRGRARHGPLPLSTSA